MTHEADPLDPLVGRARDGDDDAFEALYREVQPRLLRYLRVRSAAAAEDLAAEAWIDVVRRLPDFTGGGAQFRAWIFQIARGKYVDRVRYEQRRPAAPVASLPDVAVAPDAEVAELVAEQSATQAAIDLIRTLPPREAEVVALRVIAELDVSAVAELTGRTAVSVRVTAHRGLRRLAERLRSEAPHGSGSIVSASLPAPTIGAPE